MNVQSCAQMCARSSAASASLVKKPYLQIADINAAEGFDAFLSYAARNKKTAHLVVQKLEPLAQTHRFQKDLWDLLQTAKKTIGA